MNFNIPRKKAQVAPAGPAPTIAISKSLDAFWTKQKYIVKMLHASANKTTLYFDHLDAVCLRLCD